MPNKYDVTIVGGGLIGACFALLLAQRTDLNIALVERNGLLENNTIPGQRVLALGRAATSVLREIGIFQQLDTDSAYAYTKMCVWDYNTDAQLKFDAADFEQTKTSGPSVLGHMVDAQQCCVLLHAQLKQHDQISVFFDCEPQSIEQGRDEILLKTKNNRLHSSLLVAADGANSWVRQQTKIFCHRQSFDQSGIVAKIRTELPHQETAWQRFLNTGPIAVLPLSDNCSSIVWSANADFSTDLMQLSDEDFEQQLADVLEHKLGSVSLLSKRMAFPLLSRRADHYFKQRVVLIGDAAHSIHPLAGQGANLGFKDCLVLVDLIVRQSGSDIADSAVLNKYQRIRKIDNEQTDWLMTALHNAYQNDNAWWLLARARGVGWLAKSQSARAILINHAIG